MPGVYISKFRIKNYSLGVPHCTHIDSTRRPLPDKKKLKMASE